MMVAERSTRKLGIVPYLNVLPLLEGLEATIPQQNWVKATPRELSGLLAAGEVDVASLPIYEALRSPGYSIVPGCALACDGPVRSVQLFSRRPLNEIRHVLLDRSSLTSVHLVQVLAADHLGVRPMFELSDSPVTIDFDLATSGFDAVLVIGDVALQWEGKFPYAMDLGAAWKELTGLPFVFAAWVIGPGVQLSMHEIRAFINARHEGERASYDIAKRVAGDDTRRLLDIVAYLSRAMHYRLGDAECAAIEEFRKRLVALGLLPSNLPKLTILANPEVMGAVECEV